MTEVWPVTPGAAISFVAQNLAIGGVLAYGESLERFGLVLNVAQEFAGAGASEMLESKGVVVQHARLDDNFEVGPMVPEIDRATSLVVDALDRGLDVLVTCAAGRNRSGLVAANALIRRGLTPDRAIRTVTLCRYGALTNKTFVAWLRRGRP